MLFDHQVELYHWRKLISKKDKNALKDNCAAEIETPTITYKQSTLINIINPKLKFSLLSKFILHNNEIILFREK